MSGSVDTYWEALLVIDQLPLLQEVVRVEDVWLGPVVSLPVPSIVVCHDEGVHREVVVIKISLSSSFLAWLSTSARTWMTYS